MRKLLYFLSLIIILFTGCKQSKTELMRDDFSKYYDQFQVKGSFVLYDLNNSNYVFYNNPQFTQEFTPASTFKICNSLIGLETGVIKDENYIIQWDGMERSQIWDRDYNLKDAYKNSIVWYYQELARRVGDEKMKYWINKVKYGNANIEGGIDKFWLDGGLRITPEQQIDFLMKLQSNKLPFSQRSMDITKKIMIETQTDDYILRSKTGWGFDVDSLSDIGWYIGYIEKDGNTYFFANCVQADIPDSNDETVINNFINSRKQIVNLILADLKILD